MGNNEGSQMAMMMVHDGSKLSLPDMLKTAWASIKGKNSDRSQQNTVDKCRRKA